MPTWPKRFSKRARVWGVSAISGTSTITWPPRANTGAILCKYTSVLPLPVTPSKSKTSKRPAAASMASTAACCSALASKAGAFAASARRVAAETRVITSSSASLLIIARLKPASTKALPAITGYSTKCWLIYSTSAVCFGARALVYCAFAKCQKSSSSNTKGRPLRAAVGKMVARTSPSGWW